MILKGQRKWMQGRGCKITAVPMRGLGPYESKNDHLKLKNSTTQAMRTAAAEAPHTALLQAGCCTFCMNPPIFSN